MCVVWWLYVETKNYFHFFISKLMEFSFKIENNRDLEWWYCSDEASCYRWKNNWWFTSISSWFSIVGENWSVVSGIWTGSQKPKACSCFRRNESFGNLSTNHSSWSILLMIYNLPPWLCMKQKYIMLSMMISGPR